MRNVIKGLLALLIVSLMMTGCTGSPTSNLKGSTTVNTELTLGITKPISEADEAVWQQFLTNYMKKHPNVKIKLDFLPQENDNSAWRTRITTNLIGNTAPDIFQTRFTWTHEDYRKDLLVDMTPYFNKPNPYNGNKIWLDTFLKTTIGELREPISQSLAGVSTFTTAVRVYYNKDLFKKVGVEIPKTWSEFMNIQQKILDSGVTPFAFSNSKPSETSLLWASNLLTNQIGAETLLAYDWNKDGQMQVNEITAAVDQGVIDFNTTDWNGFFHQIKEWSKYWSKGFNAIDRRTAVDIFIRGEAAMVMGSNAHFKDMSESKARTFEIGSFLFPLLTAKEHPKASQVAYALGGQPEGIFSIPRTVSGDKLEAAIDFLMYLSSPEVAVSMSNQLFRPTTLEGIDLPDHLKFVGNRIMVNLYAPFYDTKFYEGHIQLGQLFLEGSITFEKYTSELQTILKAAADKLMKENNWSKENQYGTKK